MAAGLLRPLVAPVAARTDDNLVCIVRLEKCGRFRCPVDNLPAGSAAKAAATTAAHDKQT